MSSEHDIMISATVHMVSMLPSWLKINKSVLREVGSCHIVLRDHRRYIDFLVAVFDLHLLLV